MEGESVKGTVFKLNVHMEPIDGFHLADVDWEAEVENPTFRRKHTIKKSESFKVDDDNAIIVVDSSLLGAGLYDLTLTAWIPDQHCEGGRRKERATVSTGVRIIA